MTVFLLKSNIFFSIVHFLLGSLLKSLHTFIALVFNTEVLKSSVLSSENNK